MGNKKPQQITEKFLPFTEYSKNFSFINMGQSEQ